MRVIYTLLITCCSGAHKVVPRIVAVSTLQSDEVSAAFRAS